MLSGIAIDSIILVNKPNSKSRPRCADGIIRPHQFNSFGHNIWELAMTVCVPVRDMKNTASFTELVQKERDVTVTKNGYNSFHCLSNEEYLQLQEEAVKAKLLSRLMLAESEIAAGKYEDFDEFVLSVKAEHGL